MSPLSPSSSITAPPPLSSQPLPDPADHPARPDPLTDPRPDPRAPLPATWAGSIASRFSRLAKLQPEAPALITSRGTWSYAELDLQTHRLANALRAEGLGRGAVIAIHGRRSPALAWAILGVLKAQAAFVLLDPAHPLLWRQQQLDLTQPRGWLHLQSPNEADVPVPPAGWVGFTLPVGDVHPAGLLFADAPTSPPQAPTGPDDVAYFAFTSGTTGAPRGIIGTHRPLSHFLAWHVETFGLNNTDRFVLTAGIGHDLFLRELFTPWWCGGAVFIPSRDVASDPEAVAASLSEPGITVAHFTPSMARLLCQSATARWSDLRYACLAGEPLHYTDVDTLRSQAPAVRCVNFYGTTETPQAMGHHFIGATSAHENIVPVGKGIEGVQLLVLTAEGRLAEVGEEGEICVRTPYLSRGYLNDPERTRQRFQINPWTGAADDLLFRTGDLGRYLPEGSVAIAGRKDDEVKGDRARYDPE